jgi:hypothetical protein
MKSWFPVIFYLKSRRNEVLISGYFFPEKSWKSELLSGDCTTWKGWWVNPVTIHLNSQNGRLVIKKDRIIKERYFLYSSRDTTTIENTYSFIRSYIQIEKKNI